MIRNQIMIITYEILSGGSEINAHKIKKYTRQELKDIIETYKQKKKDVRGINKK